MRVTVEQLDKSELKKLNSLTIGYGNLSRACEKSGVPYQTLKRIILTGMGTSEYVSLIREKLLTPANVESFSE